MITTDTTPVSIFLLGLFLALIGAGLFLATNTQFGKFAGGSLIWSGALLALAGSLAISSGMFVVVSIVLNVALLPASAIVGWCMYYRKIHIDDATWTRQALVLTIFASGLGMLAARLSGIDWPRAFIMAVVIFFVETIGSMILTWTGKHVAGIMMIRRLKKFSRNNNWH